MKAILGTVAAVMLVAAFGCKAQDQGSAAVQPVEAPAAAPAPAPADAAAPAPAPAEAPAPAPANP